MIHVNKPPNLVKWFSYKLKRVTYWCPEEDSNLHTLRHTDLNRARLPIPPPGQHVIVYPTISAAFLLVLGYCETGCETTLSRNGKNEVGCPVFIGETHCETRFSLYIMSST